MHTSKSTNTIQTLLTNTHANASLISILFFIYITIGDYIHIYVRGGMHKYIKKYMVYIHTYMYVCIYNLYVFTFL